MTYAWEWWLWGVAFFLLIFALVYWRPSRTYGRTYTRDISPPYGSQLWPYAYTPMPGLGKYRGKGPRNYRRSDARIAEDINDDLMINEDVDATDIEVNVKEGVITLTGSVGSRQEKVKAEAIADSVAGVIDVRNELAIAKQTGKGFAQAA